MTLPLEFYAYIGLLNCIVSLCISVVVWFTRRDFKPARLFVYLSILIGLWSGFYFLWLRVTDDAAQASILMRTCMTFVVLMPPVFLQFISVWTGKLKNSTLHFINYLVSSLLCSTVYTR